MKKLIAGLALLASLGSEPVLAADGCAACIKGGLFALLEGPTKKDWPSIDKAALVELQTKRPKEVALYAVAPVNAEQTEKIFSDASVGTVREAKGAAEQLSKAGNLAVPTHTGDDVIRFIEQSDRPYIVFIGHNQSGSLKLSSGGSVDLGELAKTCAATKKRCIFLSCRSSEHVQSAGSSIGIKSMIRFDEAIVLYAKAASAVHSLKAKNVSDAQILSFIEASANKDISNKRYIEKAGYITATGGIGLVIYEVKD